ncbi:hypothetical protein ZWY2020_024103 [Hordeum vulgare]|nr:hypothetical protein ZWY2020_024103 [Hordeum vulgare]
MRPQMVIISRAGTRKLLNLNLDEVATAATELGINVTVAEAAADMPAFAALVNAEDVLLAVHGAGLTNQIFLPTQAVVLQIVPWWSMDRMTTNFYGQPARDMQLRYVEYYVDEQETSMTMATLNLQIQPLHYCTACSENVNFKSPHSTFFYSLDYLI